MKPPLHFHINFKDKEPNVKSHPLSGCYFSVYFISRPFTLLAHNLLCFFIPSSSTNPRFLPRYILVDWLVEVTTMKDFSSLALHVAVGCVDRYMALRTVSKAHLQLLGIACMVVCTR